MATEFERRIVQKLVFAADIKYDNNSDIDNLAYHESHINQICKEFQISRDNALAILEKVLLPKSE